MELKPGFYLLSSNLFIFCEVPHLIKFYHLDLSGLFLLLMIISTLLPECPRPVEYGYMAVSRDSGNSSES